MKVNADSQNEGLVPDGVQGLFLYVCLVNLVAGRSVLYD